MAQAEKAGRAAEFLINRDRSKGCGICVVFRPRGALYLYKNSKARVDLELSNICSVFESFYPEFATVPDKREGL